MKFENSSKVRKKGTLTYTVLACNTRSEAKIHGKEVYLVPPQDATLLLEDRISPKLRKSVRQHNAVEGVGQLTNHTWCYIHQGEAIEELRKRTTAGAATFLVKVKAHRGKPANEEADIQADNAISGKDVPIEWHDRTNRAVFTWQEPRRKGGTVSYEDRKSTWNSGVWKAIRRGSAEEEVRKHRDRLTGAWMMIAFIITLGEIM